MKLVHPDYIKLVKAAYLKLRASGQQPLLTDPSPAQLRKEMLNLYDSRYDKRDEPLLKAFFGTAETGKQFRKLIENFETDKLKPLVKYMRGGTETTAKTNVEMLAWLIDFPHRPWLMDKQFELSESEKDIPEMPSEAFSLKLTDRDPVLENENSDEVQKDGKDGNGEVLQNTQEVPGSTDNLDETGQSGTTLTSKPAQNISLSLITIVMLAIFGISMVLMNGKEKRCMYREGDRYVECDCEDIVSVMKLLSTDILPYNKDSIRLTKANEIKKGITEKVKEPETANAVANIKPGENRTNSSMSKSSVLPQCQGITKKGKQCTRKANTGGFCWQHPSKS